MAAEVIDLRERRGIEAATGREVVAVVLSDGSIRDLRTGDLEQAAETFSAGQVTGEGWTLWWERRNW